MGFDWLRQILTPKDTYRPPTDALARVLPPWVVRPDRGLTSMGWRMNGGEDLMIHRHRWYTNTTPEQRQPYQLDYPVPTDPALGWASFYTGVDRYRAEHQAASKGNE